jgi:hypothetical protein
VPAPARCDRKSVFIDAGELGELDPMIRAGLIGALPEAAPVQPACTCSFPAGAAWHRRRSCITTTVGSVRKRESRAVEALARPASRSPGIGSKQQAYRPTTWLSVEGNQARTNLQVPTLARAGVGVARG